MFLCSVCGADDPKRCDRRIHEREERHDRLLAAAKAVVKEGDSVIWSTRPFSVDNLMNAIYECEKAERITDEVPPDADGDDYKLSRAD